MIILGAGMTGCLAGYAFKNAVIHEYLETPNTHKAVLRFRSDEVSRLTDIPFKKVKVHKGIYYNGRFVQPDIFIMNRYSLKVTGGYYDRSISNIDPVERWIAPDSFHEQMLDNLEPRIFYGSREEIADLDRPIISTLPLPILASKVGISAPTRAGADKARSIYVSTVRISYCDLYQTVYSPDQMIDWYRASVTGDKVIIESVAPMTEEQIDSVLAEVFGIEMRQSIELNKEQPFGKFTPLDEDVRKDLMYEITTKHNIYSLGRHATWRKVLLDDISQDIKRIESMMKTSAYDRMLGKTK